MHILMDQKGVRNTVVSFVVRLQAAATGSEASEVETDLFSYIPRGHSSNALYMCWRMSARLTA